MNPRISRPILAASALFGATLAATPAYAEGGGLHTWSVIPPINAALQKALGVHEDLTHIIMFTFVALILAVSGAIVGGKYKKKLETGDIAPEPRFSFANFIETIISVVQGLLEEIVGHHGRKHLTLAATLTLVILFNNLAGLIPGLGLATSNINVTLGLALVIFFAYHAFGIKAHGVGAYLAHFMGPLKGPLKYAMAPIMIPIELISHVARPMSLSLRLFGNMMGDHTILGVFMVGIGIGFPVLYPLPFLALGTLVSIVQTLVFLLLSLVYIALATAEEH
ncbi:F0F1 ATP synthase subunit A [bacterium]|nr:F0F1 ATP synthase subunit A [bacterium]